MQASKNAIHVSRSLKGARSTVASLSGCPRARRTKRAKVIRVEVEWDARGVVLRKAIIEEEYRYRTVLRLYSGRRGMLVDIAIEPLSSKPKTGQWNNNNT